MDLGRKAVASTDYSKIININSKFLMHIIIEVEIIFNSLSFVLNDLVKKNAYHDYMNAIKLEP